MDDFIAHPDDETLYDLVEGLLDPAREAEVARHLASCASCATFAEAGLAGSNVVDDAREAMPADVAERMLLALDTTWRELQQPAAVTPPPVAHPLPPVEPTQDTIVLSPIPPGAAPLAEPIADAPARGRRRRVRARALVPVLAIIAVATVAGTSWFAGEQRASEPSGDASTAATSAPEAAAGGAVAEPASTQYERGDAVTDAAAGADDASADAAEDLPPVCIATPDETRLSLPDGRVARRIVRGPLGIYVVCG